MNKFLFASVLAIASAASFGQYASVNDFNVGGGYFQDFDSFGSVAVSLSGSTTDKFGSVGSLNEWMYNNTLGSTAFATAAAGTGSSNSGGFYNWGTAANATDRAFGSLTSGALASTNNVSWYGLGVTNNTTDTGFVALDFDLEQYRLGVNSPSVFDGLTVSYALIKGGDADLTAANLSNNALFFSDKIVHQTSSDNYATLSPLIVSSTVYAPLQVGTVGALATPSTVNVRMSIQLFAAGQTWEVGDRLLLRFTDLNPSGSDHGFGVDNVRVVPEPASMAVLGLGILGLARRRRNK